MSKVEEIKIMTLGNSSVGKTSFILKLTDNTFIENYLSTLGVDFKQKEIKLKSGKNVRLRIFDTAGQERFKTPSLTFVKKTDGIILIYDISNYESFKATNGWMEGIKENGKEDLPIILVGNKCDLSDDNRQVSLKEGEDKAQEFQIPFFETSCKDGININEVFEKLCEDILERGNRKIDNEVKILNKKEKKKKCC